MTNERRRSLFSRLAFLRYPLQDWPLFAKLTLAVSAVVLPVILVINLVTIFILRSSIATQTGASLQTLAQIQARSVSDKLVVQVSNLRNLARETLLIVAVENRNSAYVDPSAEIAQHESEWVAATPERRQALTALPTVISKLSGFLQTYPNHAQLVLVDQYGSLIAATTPPDHYDLSKTPWWQATYNKGQGGIYVGPAQLDSQLGAFVAEMAVPVFINNQVAGALLSTYNLQTLTQELEVSRIGQTGRSDLFDAFGIWMPAEQSEKTPDPQHPEKTVDPRLDWSRVLDTAKPTWAILPYFDESHIIAWAPITSGDAQVTLANPEWRVVVHQTTAEALAPALTGGVTLFAIVAVGALGLVVILIRILSGSITEPLAELTQVVQHLREGVLTVRARLTRRDEIGQLAEAFNNMASNLQGLTTALEKRVAERTEQLAAINQVAQVATSVLDVNELLARAVNLIRDRFSFYHVSIFMLDPSGEYAVVRESTGEIGKLLKQQGHRLAIGSESMVGWATANRRPRVALDVELDETHFKNPLLPDTRSEIALPLIVGDKLIGALDVQSTVPNAFSEGDVQVLQTLADQVSVAIENAELFQRTQASLREVSALYQQSIGSSWQTLLHGQEREIVYQLERSEAEPTAAEVTAPLQIPLKLRGQIVGVIEFHGQRPGNWITDEAVVFDTVATQLSAAFESAALFEETQRRSQREQLINDITYQMRSSLNPLSVIHSGMRELGRALGATEVVVKLTPSEKPTPSPITEKP
jgi:GAF domain-containing protein/HAMP domain-containing protein